MRAVVAALTREVPIWKERDVEPADTVTVAGTVRTGFDDVSLTGVPPEGAGDVR